MTNTSKGKTLYQTVPTVYRTRDNGDLRKYFAANGTLLDQIHATLEQRLADAFPDNPIDGSLACQEWLIPYFADLLDVRLVSPSVQGKRDEVANAVRWRQGKGTLQVIEQIAESVGRLEVVIQEGWKRVAVTPRLDRPLIPATAYGYSQEVSTAPPSIAVRHPGLPAVTVDFRCPSGAVATTSSNPAAQQSIVDENAHTWRQSSLHGVPCYPGSYEDRSLRTVDLRCSDWRIGHYHPDRILLYTVPPAGYFHPESKSVNWSESPSNAFVNLIDIIEADGVTIFRNKTYGCENYIPVNIRRTIRLGQVPDGVGDKDFHTWRFEGVNLLNTLEIDSGRVELVDCAARKVEVHSIDFIKPVITARNCLIKNIQAARGLVVLEYCTVLDTTLSEILNASDCIFLGLIHRHHTPDFSPPERSCVRYSRIEKTQSPSNDAMPVDDEMRLINVTRSKPVMFSEKFSERGCGVLHPATPQSIRQGAEDGGEMGVYHDQHLSLLPEAVVDKLRDYLPLGTEAVVIPDERMLKMPG